MTDSATKPLDVVVWGATGFTGKLVAEAIARRYGVKGELRWAIGGRNRDKLAAVRDELAREVTTAAAELELIVGDAGDTASLEALADKTRVVCTTVGPYGRYGTPLVDVCARRGVHYCDLTGETPWMRETIAAFDETARLSGARIVHTCGFDSIPSDLGVLVLQDKARELDGAPVDEVRMVVTRMRGGLSGGTAASMLDIAEKIGDPATRRALGDPYALDPPGSPRGQDKGDQHGVGYEKTLGLFTAPFVMAAVNTRVVRRSNALLGHAYGESFRYSEVVGAGRGAKGLTRALSWAAGMGAFMVGVGVPPVRALLAKRVLPKPGEGPSRDKREAGYFEVTLVGLRDGKPRVRGLVTADKDPGYGASAIMLGESAACLALEEQQLPWSGGGVLTPATAMGTRLVERLRAAGMTLEAERWS